MPRKLAYRPGNGNGKAPKLCLVCDRDVPKGRHKYCGKTCADVARRASYRTHNGNNNSRTYGYFACKPGGCVFYDVCRAMVWRPDWDPYCFPSARLHPLFTREYGKDAVEADAPEPIRIELDVMMEAA